MPRRDSGPHPEPVPFFDLSTQHRQIREEALAAVTAVADSNRFIFGPAVSRFEAALAEQLGVSQAIGVSSGTDALLMALMAIGIAPGDEVITTPFTFVATAEVVSRCGARPVFADIDPQTFLIEPDAVRGLVTERTRAILPVHLFGRLCEMDGFVTLAKERRLVLIEDCAQSLGARRDGRSAGSFGLCGAFSFFPTKNLGAWGDAGMVVTNDPDLAERLRRIRDHGATRRDCYEVLGGNFRLDTLQAAVLEVKLTRLAGWIAARRAAAHRYEALFAQSNLVAPTGTPLAPDRPILLPDAGEGEEHAFNLFVVCVAERDALRQFLDAEGIHTAVYYSVPVHLQRCFSSLGYKPGDLPVAEEAARTVLALPFFPEITAEQQARVVETVALFFRNRC